MSIAATPTASLTCPSPVPERSTGARLAPTTRFLSATDHWDARWPDPPYPGVFAGEQIHSHQYREPDQLQGRRVVVVGMGNSGMDIAVDASYVAAATSLSVRRAQWVMPKYVGGKAADQRPLPPWLPWPVRSRLLELSVRGRADPSAHGLPHPDHRPGESHPVQCERLFDRIDDGRISPRPGIDHIDHDRVVFVDGSWAPADVIVWATGYRVSFPFFDPAFLCAPANRLALWKRTIHPETPGLYFIGLLQPLGAVMPLAEAQSAWIAELLTGRYHPPSAGRIRRQTVAEQHRMEKRFYRSARHTMEVDFDAYLTDLRREQRAGQRRSIRNHHVPSIPARAHATGRAAPVVA